MTDAIPEPEIPSQEEDIQSKLSSVVTNMSGDLQKYMSTGRLLKTDWNACNRGFEVLNEILHMGLSPYSIFFKFLF